MEHLGLLGDVGIVGYGVCISELRIETDLIVQQREKKRKDLQDFRQKVRDGLLLRYKSLPGEFEDTITIASGAAGDALDMWGGDPNKIGVVAVGSESKPYAVGTIARHAASFVGVGNNVYVADLEGACNAGMQSLSFVEGLVSSGKVEFGLAIGADVAQSPIGDALEYACGAGGAAFVIGSEDPIAILYDMAPYSSLNMDFFRRDGADVPSHFGKTTIHSFTTATIGAIEGILMRHDIKLKDFDYLTFHQPSGYMPLKVCKILSQECIEELSDKSLEDRIRITPDFVEEKVKPWLRVLDIGNTYAASTPIAICDILDHAEPGQNILAVSFGSGNSAIATWLKTTDALENRRRVRTTPTVSDYIKHGKEVSFDYYEARFNPSRKKLIRPTEMGKRMIIVQVEPVGSERIKYAIEELHKRVYLPPRKCLDYDCKGELKERELPKYATVKKAEKLELTKGSIERRKERILKILLQNDGLYRAPFGGHPQTLEVASPELPVHLSIGKLYDEGRAGIINYGPFYVPCIGTQARLYSRLDRSQATSNLATALIH